MSPENITKEDQMESVITGMASLIGRVGTYARLVILGVWFPGFLIFSEMGSTYFFLFRPSGKGLVGYIAETIKQLNSPVALGFAVVLVLAVSIAIGYVARDVAFALSDFWLRRVWRPTRKLSAIYAEIRHVYGDLKVKEVTDEYGVFGLASGDDSLVRRMPESYVREFCKQWLKLRAPSLNTEGLEIEINMEMGLVMPVALAGTVFLWLPGKLLGIVLACGSIAAAWFMMYRISWARDFETEQSIVNFLFAHWEGLSTGTIAAPADVRRAERADR
jgi:hypothetical protein